MSCSIHRVIQPLSTKKQADPVKLKLTTMTGKDTVKSEMISGLRVRDYSSTTYIDPPVYTKDCIPVNHAHLRVKARDPRSWHPTKITLRTQQEV